MLYCSFCFGLYPARFRFPNTNFLFPPTSSKFGVSFTRSSQFCFQAVESMKREKGAPRPRLSKRESLANVFGRPFSWRWFSPFHPPAPMTPVIPPPTAIAIQDGETTDGTASDIEMQHQHYHHHYQHHHHHHSGHEQKYNDVYLV